jgi:RNA polymerase subunit RPABC4/transcription elongation factor Spt4
MEYTAMGPAYVECDYCREPVRIGTGICPHCHQNRVTKGE